MNIHPVVKKILAVLALIGAVITLYLTLARPYQLRWGATEEEIDRTMPGDEINRTPTFLATRAITIRGTPEQIWPWLLQMGYGRAGFYAYDIFENMGSPRGVRSAETILPEFQQFNAGDPVPISAAGGLTFHAVEPNRYLVWEGEGAYGGFIWALYPLGEGQTRLVSRARLSYSWDRPAQLLFDLLTEFTDPLAVRKILQGVKGRVEGRIEPMAQANAEFAIYLVTAFIFLAAVILILVRPLTWRTWLDCLAAGLAWLLTWYAPVPIWIGAALALAILWELSRRKLALQKAG